MKMRLISSWSFKRSACSACHEHRLDRLCANPLRIDAAAVVRDFDDHLAPFVEGVQRQSSFRRLACCCSLFG